MQTALDEGLLLRSCGVTRTLGKFGSGFIGPSFGTALKAANSGHCTKRILSSVLTSAGFGVHPVLQVSGCSVSRNLQFFWSKGSEGVRESNKNLQGD